MVDGVEKVLLSLKHGSQIAQYSGLDQAILGLNRNRVVMGTKKIGRGYVITLPYRLSLNEYDGPRLIGNLELWSVRNKLARREIRRKFGPKNYDVIYWKNGDIAAAKVLNETFRIRLSYGVLSIEKDKITSILFNDDGKGTDVIKLKNSDRLSGEIELKTLDFTLPESKNPEKKFNSKKNEVAGLDIGSKM